MPAKKKAKPKMRAKPRPKRSGTRRKGTRTRLGGY